MIPTRNRLNEELANRASANVSIAREQEQFRSWETQSRRQERVLNSFTARAARNVLWLASALARHSFLLSFSILLSRCVSRSRRREAEKVRISRRVLRATRASVSAHHRCVHQRSEWGSNREDRGSRSTIEKKGLACRAASCSVAIDKLLIRFSPSQATRRESTHFLPRRFPATLFEGEFPRPLIPFALHRKRGETCRARNFTPACHRVAGEVRRMLIRLLLSLKGTIKGTQPPFAKNVDLSSESRCRRQPEGEFFRAKFRKEITSRARARARGQVMPRA